MQCKVETSVSPKSDSSCYKKAQTSKLLHICQRERWREEEEEMEGTQRHRRS